MDSNVLEEEDDDICNPNDEKNMNARTRATSFPCSARSFADPFLMDTSTTKSNTRFFLLPCVVGMRHSASDQGAVVDSCPQLSEMAK
jgi:hypothetical protein